MTDGLLILRAMLGLSGDALTAGAVNTAHPNARNAQQILTWIESTHGVACWHPLVETPAAVAIKGTRSVDYALDGRHEATIYNGDLLQPGMTLSGPAIIEDAGTTVVVHPGNTVSMDAYRNLHITLAQ